MCHNVHKRSSNEDEDEEDNEDEDEGGEAMEGHLTKEPHCLQA